MKTSLQAIAKKTAEQPGKRFQNLYALLNEENLRWSFAQLRKDAAAGVDRVSYQDYEKDLEANLKDLVLRLKEKRYRAQLVRRKHIPKPGSDKKRPLGIPALEDKILQHAVAHILTAIYEPGFLECSYGYRPKKSAHDALKAIDQELNFGEYHWVVEADIRGFFEHLNHDWLVRMLEQRVDDRALIRLIKKWLKAGVLEEDGEVIHPATGCPQGGIISPILSNIYLHHVLDLWFDQSIQGNFEGPCVYYRYADDFVAAFGAESNARAFEYLLKERLSQFGLQVAEEKTRVLRFSRFGGKANGKFDFLGFEFSWGLSRQGKGMIKRRTSPRKLRASMRNFTGWIRKHRHLPKRKLLRELKRKLTGYGNYYGLRGNAASLRQFCYLMRRVLFKWLNRRSQRRSYNWEQFDRMLQRSGIGALKARQADQAAQLDLGLQLIVIPSWV